jgi:methylglutaconyl-CoA hydratase
MSYLKIAVVDRVCTITMNRPEKRNAFNGQLIEELLQAFRTAGEQEEVRVIVLTGEGPAFSAGADLDYLKQLQVNTHEENLADSSLLASLFKEIYTSSKPVIAKVKGHAIAGGCGLATVCDLSYAVPEAQFGYTEVKIGFIPAVVMVFLLRKVGEAKAKELLLTGKLVTAQEAYQDGLITGIVKPDQIDDYVAEQATLLASGTSGNSVTLTKEMIAKVQSMSIEDGLEYAAEMNAKARSTDDCIRGIAAFLSKEKITW